MYAIPGDNTNFHLSSKSTIIGLKWGRNILENGWILGAKMEFDFLTLQTITNTILEKGLFYLHYQKTIPAGCLDNIGIYFLPLMPLH